MNYQGNHMLQKTSTYNPNTSSAFSSSHLGTMFFEGVRYSTPDKQTFIQLYDTERKPITTVDGGSATLFQNGSLAISFVRIIALTLPNYAITKHEGFLVAKTIFPEDQLSKPTIELTFHKIEPHQTISQSQSLNERLTQSRKLFDFTELSQQPLETALNAARKFLEWELCTQLMRAAEITSSILWDGILSVQYPFEKPPNVTGLAKSTSGIGNLQQFLKNAPHKPWKLPLDKQKNSYLVKLHPSSNHIFRVDDHCDAIDQLRAWSKDPSFLGYPYPLIIVDQLARVSNEEKNILEYRLPSIVYQLTKQKWGDIQLGTTLQMGHTILDNLQY